MSRVRQFSFRPVMVCVAPVEETGSSRSLDRLDDRTERNVRFGGREFEVRTYPNDDRWVSNANHASAET